MLDWNSRLALALETVEYWVLCQKNWLYLENVFSAVDIQRYYIASTFDSQITESQNEGYTVHTGLSRA